jgi:tRNA (mo5U34)-methyltransferase
MDREELMKRIRKIVWVHRIDLGNGIVTPGRWNTQWVLEKLHLPEDLRGKTVLDVGAWDGFYSFEAERRGARRVLAIDSPCWGGEGEGWGTKDGFNLAKEVLNSKVEDRVMNLFDLSPEKVGTFDVVFFLGVLYHMRHPILALERVASVTSEQLIMETHVDLLEVPRPAIAFYPGDEAYDDPTNWCGPNIMAVEAMLKAVGFRRVKVVEKWPASSLKDDVLYQLRGMVTRKWPIKQIRCVLHAWKRD